MWGRGAVVAQHSFLGMATTKNTLTSLNDIARTGTTVGSTIPSRKFYRRKTHGVPIVTRMSLIITNKDSHTVTTTITTTGANDQICLINCVPCLNRSVYNSRLCRQRTKRGLRATLTHGLFPKGGFPAPLRVGGALRSRLVSGGMRFLCDDCMAGILASPSNGPTKIIVTGHSNERTVHYGTVVSTARGTSITKLLKTRHGPFVTNSRRFYCAMMKGAPGRTPRVVRTRRLSRPVGINRGDCPIAHCAFRLPLGSSSCTSLTRIRRVVHGQA